MRRIFWFALILVWANLSLVFGQNRALDPTDVARIQSVTGVTLSPDGRYVAATVAVPADPLEENAYASVYLHLLDVQSGTMRPFATQSSVNAVAFRPEHNAITFLSRRDGDKALSLYEISLAGGEAYKLYEFSESILEYDWGPEGEKLAFIARESASPSQTNLPYKPIVYEEENRNRQLYVLDNLSADPRRAEIDGSFYELAWNPDGAHLATTLAPSPLIDDQYMARRIHVLDSRTLSSTNEIEHLGKKGQLTWSPDGNQLAFIAGANINDPIDGRLFVVGRNEPTPRALQANLKGKFEHIQWKDDNTLFFLASKGVNSVVGSLGANGRKMQEIVARENLNITDFGWNDRGVWAFVAQTPQHPGEVYLQRPGEIAPRRISNLNPWLEEIAMGRQEVVKYEARDGVEIEGMVIYPTDYRQGQRYPVITVVHGGPESHYNNGWLTAYSLPGQLAAGRGYAVFYPNYRGSTGRGREFAMSSQGDLAGAEFDDIVDGVDYLIERGIADEARVGVTGGSYGGYATGWMATRYTDRFAAGVMFVGISNNLSKWGTGDIPEELFLVHARKRVWEDYNFFLERSPIYYAGQAKTPLLIMAGAEDTRVHPSQSIELYRHIKARTETPVRLVLYPGEGHGNRRATARLDYTLRMLRWFDTYLMDQSDAFPETEIKAGE